MAQQSQHKFKFLRFIKQYIKKLKKYEINTDLLSTIKNKRRLFYLINKYNNRFKTNFSSKLVLNDNLNIAQKIKFLKTLKKYKKRISPISPHFVKTKFQNLPVKKEDIIKML